MSAAIGALAESLHEEATEANERRLIVLAGGRERGYEHLGELLEAVPVAITETTLVGPDDRLRCEHLRQANAGSLLGRTRRLVALDAHQELRPNALGQAVGAVDGGGLLVLLAPPLEAWPIRRDAFDESMAAPPYTVGDVTGRFKRRLVERIRTHRGIAIVDVDAGRIDRDGHVDRAPRLVDTRAAEPMSPSPPTDHRFPIAVYEACLTADQVNAVASLESILDPDPTAVVLESDRGRGKSSAAGLAAGSLAIEGESVVITAREPRNASEVLQRARELCARLEGASETDRNAVFTDAGGSVRYLEPDAAIEAAADVDVMIVDEAASMSVARLDATLEADRVVYATTIHGYEGAGRGFSVRFRDRLASSRHAVSTCTLVEPIRYAAGDPIETWAFRALALDARPVVDSLVADATPESVSYTRLDAETLLDDERLLYEVFGLLVLAHYRTEPADLARLLDAPNLGVRALLADDHVISVALLAREGDLSAAWRARMYEGERIRGHMIPDVLTSQLRDESAGGPAGYRVVRIATHHAVRSRGLGSTLLSEIRSEVEPAIDWLGAGFGATPALLSFWRENDYVTVHVSTTRNDASGEHSAIMLHPTSEAGTALLERHSRRFVRRFPAVTTDVLADLDPDVVRAVLASVDAMAPLSLSDHEWTVVAGAAYGPGLFDVDPGPFRRLVVRYFTDGVEDGDSSLSVRQERLLVCRVLQARSWGAVADELGYHSSRECMRAFGDALRPLVDRYGTDAARRVRDRFE